jgi:hypothetical protein
MGCFQGWGFHEMKTTNDVPIYQVEKPTKDQPMT